MTKQSEIAEYRAALATNPAWAHRALVVLHDRQTRDEQETRTTETHNGVGFTGIDAEILSSFAEQVKRGRTLSVKQLAIAHRRLPKYAAQLWRIAQEKAQAAPEVSARAQEEARFRAETDAWLAAHHAAYAALPSGTIVFGPAEGWDGPVALMARGNANPDEEQELASAPDESWADEDSNSDEELEECILRGQDEFDDTEAQMYPRDHELPGDMDPEW